MAIRIDGKALAAKVKEQVRAEAAKLRWQAGLAVILVGENPASKVYVAGKEKDCAECGIHSFPHKLPEETTQEELLDLIRTLNDDPAVDGILCQLPLPRHLDEEAVINAIRPDKDVDCFHPFNVGRMVIGQPVFLPCTRYGDAEGIRDPHSGEAVRGAGPQQHRGQTHEHAADPGGRHRYHLPLPDGEFGIHHPGGRHSGLRHRPDPLCHGGHGEGRRRGHRCGHEPG